MVLAQADGPLSVEEIAARTGITNPGTVRTELSRMRSTGKVGALWADGPAGKRGRRTFEVIREEQQDAE
jgi:hypothetical protein